MNKKNLVYELVSLIPSGKVLTYGQIAKFLKVKSVRFIGYLLHQNPDPKNIPCHRVVFSDGSLSKSYVFGGRDSQERKLIKEGVKFYLRGNRVQDRKVDLKKCLWQPTKVLRMYFFLLEKFGPPGPWPWFCDDQPHTKEEIVIGAILTQNTNWRNAQKAIDNLRKNKINSLAAVYQLGKKDLNRLKQLIRPSGFYNQKGERLFSLTKFIIDNYKNLENFFKLSEKKARDKLLSIKGIGEETADTILLYAGDKPVFIIDTYTERFVDKYFKDLPSFSDRAKMVNYEFLQKFFMDNLPANLKLFQDYHALIIRWGKIKTNS